MSSMIPQESRAYEEEDAETSRQLSVDLLEEE
jgi:hypothetical protein